MRYGSLSLSECLAVALCFQFSLHVREQAGMRVGFGMRCARRTFVLCFCIDHDHAMAKLCRVCHGRPVQRYHSV